MRALGGSGLLGSLNRDFDALEVRICSCFGMQTPALETLFAFGILLLLPFLFFSALLEVVVGFLGQCRLHGMGFPVVGAEWLQEGPGCRLR